MSRSSKKLLALLTAAAIPACAEWSTPPPAGTSIQLEKLPRVDNSPVSPCWQQKQIAAQNSYIKQTEAKGDVTFKAPCDLEQKAEPKKVARAK